MSRPLDLDLSKLAVDDVFGLRESLLCWCGQPSSVTVNCFLKSSALTLSSALKLNLFNCGTLQRGLVLVYSLVLGSFPFVEDDGLQTPEDQEGNEKSECT